MGIPSNQAGLAKKREGLLSANNELQGLVNQFQDAIKHNDPAKIDEICRKLGINTKNLEKQKAAIDRYIVDRIDVIEINEYRWAQEKKLEDMLQEMEVAEEKERKKFIEKQAEFIRWYLETKLSEANESEKARALALMHAKLNEEINRLNKELEALIKERDSIFEALVQLKQQLQELQKELQALRNDFVSALDAFKSKMLSGGVFPDDSSVDKTKFHAKFLILIDDVLVGRVAATDFDDRVVKLIKNSGKDDKELNDEQTAKNKVYFDNALGVDARLLLQKMRLAEDKVAEKQKAISAGEEQLAAANARILQTAAKVDGLQAVRDNLEAGRYAPDVSPARVVDYSDQIAAGKLKLTPHEERMEPRLSEQLGADNYHKPGLLPELKQEAKVAAAVEAVEVATSIPVRESDKKAEPHIAQSDFAEIKAEEETDKNISEYKVEAEESKGLREEDEEEQEHHVSFRRH